MKHAICSDGIFLAAPLSTIYWNVPDLKNKDKKTLVYCVTYEGKYELLRTGEKLNPAYNLKAVFPENSDVTAAPL